MAINAGKSLDEVLQMAVQELVLALDGDSGALFFLSSDGSSLEGVAEWGIQAEPIKGLVFDLASLPSSRHTLDERRPSYFSFAEAEADERLIAKKYGVKGRLVIPVLADSKTIGVAYVNYRDPHLESSEDDKFFASALAAQCALALQKELSSSKTTELDDYKDEFLSVVAHALKSPLTALKGYTQLLLRKAAKRPELEGDLDNIQAIESQANRILNVVNKLLDFGRIQLDRFELNREPVELAHLVNAMVEQARASVYKHELVVEANPDHVLGNWDRKAIERVIYSLLDNAIRYSPEGGRIEVRISGNEGEVTVSIRDRGIGISKEEQSHLFERYFRSKTAADQKLGGLGLGLYISKAITEAHGGRVWAESEPGRGSTFSFSLPLK